ncbi:uncharacterized protein LOC134329561 [Trichomycterus rosablanca]|uniref:uncharacterized protein LOC134329561 n=1 Tax=Trichomycterus rosablanca TaxID=2290929 RepID=UPI002F35CD8B
MACWIFQIISYLAINLWFFPLITSDTTDSVLHCFSMIIVPRNTVWSTRVMGTLMINCTVTIEPKCLNKISILWCKFEENSACKPIRKSELITTELININESFQMSFLKFENMSRNDSGRYRCELSTATSVGHSILVNVTDIPFDKMDLEVVSKENKTSTNSSNTSQTDFAWVWQYLYIGSGVVLLVIIVLVPVLVIRCRVKKLRKARIYKTAQNQTTATQMADLSLPALNTMTQKPLSSVRGKTHSFPAQLNPPSPCIYDNVPLRVASQRHRSSPPGLPAVRGAPRRSHDHGKVEEEEEEDRLVYASLNHKAALQRPVRVTHTEIEASEYAAIKVS